MSKIPNWPQRDEPHDWLLKNVDVETAQQMLVDCLNCPRIRGHHDSNLKRVDVEIARQILSDCLKMV